MVFTITVPAPVRGKVHAEHPVGAQGVAQGLELQGAGWAWEPSTLNRGGPERRTSCEPSG